MAAARMRAGRFGLTVWLVVIGSCHAAGTFDGTYVGTREVTRGFLPYCQQDNNYKIVVLDNRFSFHFWKFWVEVNIDPDGNFETVTSYSDGKAEQRVYTSGRVNSRSLDYIVDATCAFKHHLVLQSQ